MRRGRPLALSLVLGFCMISSCSTSHPQVLANPCAGGNSPGGRLTNPVVCIDDSGTTLSTFPDTVHAWDRTRWFKNPVRIEWYTRSGTGDITIKAEPGCVNMVPGTKKPGFVEAQTIRLGAGPDTKRCKYDVILENSRFEPLDPDIVITRCCTSM